MRLFDEVEVLIETYEADVAEDWRPHIEDHLFDDLDRELLYQGGLDGFEDDPAFSGPPGMAPMGFENWFVPFNTSRRLPPYAEELPPGEQPA